MAESVSLFSSTILHTDNPPSPRRTMEALRDLGYDSYASLLDLIDNSVDAHATTIEVSVSESRGDIRIEVLDDGCGMDEETLIEALRLGSETSRDAGDLGKFGMGLVTASIGLSQRVEVYTRERGGALLFGGFDLQEIAERNEFIKFTGTPPSAFASRIKGESGTLVALSKTDRIVNRRPTQFANILRKRIGQVFRKFLKAGVKIAVNEVPAEAYDPLMLGHQDTRLLLETEIPTEDGGSAMIRVVELPDLGAAANKDMGIIPQNSGFYIVRNNREIMESQSFEFYKMHADYSHFRAEVSFDGSLDGVFHTDVKKMSINPSQGFLDRLRQATYTLIQQCGREGRKRANVSKGEVDHSIAEANIKRRASLIPKPLALLEKRQPRHGTEKHTQKNGSRNRVPHVTQLRTISGLEVRFDEGNYGDQAPFYLVDQKTRVITVTYNRDHPFWREFLEHADDTRVVAMLDYLVFSMANAELLVPEQAQIVKSNINTTLVGLMV